MTEHLFPTLGPVTLRVADLAAVSHFYCTLLDLELREQSPQEHLLAAQGRPLLRLQAAPNLPPAPAGRPGLFHAAFLLPTRADLGRWLAHAAQLNLPIGSGDHLVSEAFYLNDPEGNGIEVYADRPREGWSWVDGRVQMDTLAVDLPDVLSAAGLPVDALQRGEVPPYQAPATTVGHVHLKVGSAAQAARFYQEALGLEHVSALPGAAFLSWGGYHIILV
ncbi:MAG: VOC family protein [Deinococcus sp.]|nr:VOC family protein [Deinococcus sp.]